jgi:hypothetical protein
VGLPLNAISALIETTWSFWIRKFPPLWGWDIYEGWRPCLTKSV